MDNNNSGYEALDKIKNSPFYSIIQDSPFYSLLKIFSSAYSPAIDSFAKESVERFFQEFQKYVIIYYIDNLKQIISIAFFIAFFLLLGLCLVGNISWVQFLLILLLLVAVSFAIFGIYIAYISYISDVEIKKIKSNVEKFTVSKVETIKDLIQKL